MSGKNKANLTMLGRIAALRSLYISTEKNQQKLTFEGKKNRRIKRITLVMSFGLIGAACFDRLRSYYGDTLTLMVEFDKDVTDCELFYNDTEFVPSDHGHQVTLKPPSSATYPEAAPTFSGTPTRAWSAWMTPTWAILTRLSRSD